MGVPDAISAAWPPSGSPRRGVPACLLLADGHAYADLAARQESDAGPDAAFAHPGHKSGPCVDAEDQDRATCGFAVPYGNGALNVRDLNALTVTAAVAARPPCQLGGFVLHFQTPSLNHI